MQLGPDALHLQLDWDVAIVYPEIVFPATSPLPRDSKWGSDPPFFTNIFFILIIVVIPHFKSFAQRRGNSWDKWTRGSKCEAWKGHPEKAGGSPQGLREYGGIP